LIHSVSLKLEIQTLNMSENILNHNICYFFVSDVLLQICCKQLLTNNMQITTTDQTLTSVWCVSSEYYRCVTELAQTALPESHHSPTQLGSRIISFSCLHNALDKSITDKY